VFRCGNLLSKNPRMREVFDHITTFGKVDATVLIEGESGTGKLEAARAIHQASAARRSGPLIVMNCGACPETLLESELFGHVKGVFARPEGVVRPGALEKARGGTVYLSHIECVPTRVQVKLVSVLRERRAVRVGEDREFEVDVRIIASTLSPDELAKEEFRQDLRYRLQVLRLRLPPLRERPEDIPLLARHFTQQSSDPAGPPAEFSPAAMEVLLRSEWPGNVRELENAIERACFLAKGGLIRPEHLSRA
jgi:DNA-binding NtrC family response regulator